MLLCLAGESLIEQTEDGRRRHLRAKRRSTAQNPSYSLSPEVAPWTPLKNRWYRLGPLRPLPSPAAATPEPRSRRRCSSAGVQAQGVDGSLVPGPAGPQPREPAAADRHRASGRVSAVSLPGCSSSKARPSAGVHPGPGPPAAPRSKATLVAHLPPARPRRKTTPAHRRPWQAGAGTRSGQPAHTIRQGDLRRPAPTPGQVVP